MINPEQMKELFVANTLTPEQERAAQTMWNEPEAKKEEKKEKKKKEGKTNKDPRKQAEAVEAPAAVSAAQ